MQSRQKRVNQFNRNWPILFYHLLTTLYYSIQKVYNYLMETHECILVYDVYLAWTNGQIILWCTWLYYSDIHGLCLDWYIFCLFISTIHVSQPKGMKYVLHHTYLWSVKGLVSMAVVVAPPWFCITNYQSVIWSILFVLFSCKLVVG